MHTINDADILFTFLSFITLNTHPYHRPKPPDMIDEVEARRPHPLPIITFFKQILDAPENA
jgi:hypothetical protein